MKKRWTLMLPLLAGGALSLACATPYPGPYDEPDSRYARPYYPPRDARYGYSNERFAALAHELDDRAARAHQIAEGLAVRRGPREQEFFERIHHFSDMARDFHERYESGQINSRGQLRAEIGHLLDDARATDDAIRGARVLPEVVSEWQAVIRVLQRMLEVVPA